MKSKEMVIHSATSTIDPIAINPAREAVSAIGMTLALLSLGMLFAALMLGYFIFRLNAPIWPPMGMERVGLFYPIISSALIALSSVSYYQLERRSQRPHQSHSSRGASMGFSFAKALWPSLTLLLGVGFLVSQGLLWKSLGDSGLHASAGIFPSFIYGLTWAHGGHLFLALFFVALLIAKGGRFKDWQAEVLWVRNIGKLWHFLGFVWFILFLAVFVF